MSAMNRRGDLEKCPACGWGLDPGAYRCPKCRIYFCFKCRARVGERERQYQCADQSCKCYGKLLCSACVVSVNQTQHRPSFDATIVTVAGGVVAGGVALAAAPFVVAAGVGIAATYAANRGMRALGFNGWGSTDKREDYQCAHICCVQCRHPVKHLR